MIKKFIENIKHFNDSIQTEPRSGKLYAVTALYDTPDQIIAAADAVAGAGYKKFDVMTPYPLHGMDDAMKLKESKIGWVAFFAGITGTTLAFLMMWWMAGVNYKNVYGGKPFFNLPPSIPIMFEVTVLIGALTLVGALIAVFARLPWLSNPLQDTNFMKHCTSDKYGIYIESADLKFNEAEIKNLFSGLGSSEISNVYWPIVDEGKTKAPIMDYKFVGTLVLVAILTAAGTYLTVNKLIYEVVPFTWMHEQPKVLPQTKSTFFSDGFS